MTDPTPPTGEPDPGATPPSLRERYSSARERGDELVHRAQERFDEERRRRSWLETVWQSLVRMERRGGPLLSGGLAYRIFLWELPMALVLVSILGLFVDLGSIDVGRMAHDVGLSAALTATVAQAVAQAESSAWWLLLLGVWLTLWTARSAVSALRLIHRIAWEQEQLPRINQLLAPLVFSAVLLLALASNVAAGQLAAGSVVRRVVTWLVLLGLNLALVTFAMVLLPRAGRPWPVVLPGAALFTIVVEAMTIASKVYFADKLDRVDDLYGSLGIAIVVLLWLYALGWGWIAGTFINAGFQGVTSGTTVGEASPSASGGAAR
jgi:membrane protein